MVLLCKSYKNGVFGRILRVPPQQSIENARHFMPCTECMSVNCMRRAQAACSMHALQGGLTPPMRTLRGAAGFHVLRTARRATEGNRQRMVTRTHIQQENHAKTVRKTAENKCACVTGGDKGPGNRPGSPRMDHKRAEIGPRSPQERPRASQERPNSGPRAPKRATRAAKRCPREAQGLPKRGPRGSKKSPKCDPRGNPARHRKNLGFFIYPACG